LADGERDVTVTEAQAFRYVLSAGRTGTVFLAGLLNRQPGVIASHEPDSSRYQMMLANLRNDWGIGGDILKMAFERARKQRLEAAAGRTYVEINPFLCPMTDLLPMPGRELRIVHMVRDPATWAVSIVSHKASSRYRGIIDYVPFGKPYPVPRPAGWRRLGTYTRALWRWNWCNQRISELQHASDGYCIVRYEDLFADDTEIRNTVLQKIGCTLLLPAALKESDAPMHERANASSGNAEGIDRTAAQRICGEMARRYGYDY
jgi:hypothetical protein